MRIFENDGIKSVAVDDLVELWMADQVAVHGIVERDQVDPDVANLALRIIQSDACLILLAAGGDVSMFDAELVKAGRETLDHWRGAREIHEALDDIPDDLSELLDAEWEAIMDATEDDSPVECVECGHDHFVSHTFDNGGHYVTCPICPPDDCRDDTK